LLFFVPFITIIIIIIIYLCAQVLKGASRALEGVFSGKGRCATTRDTMTAEFEDKERAEDKTSPLDINQCQCPKPSSVLVLLEAPLFGFNLNIGGAHGGLSGIVTLMASFGFEVCDVHEVHHIPQPHPPPVTAPSEKNSDVPSRKLQHLRVPHALQVDILFAHTDLDLGGFMMGNKQPSSV
jgi:hypothetical protein